MLSVTDERKDRVNTYATNLSEIARLITTIAANDSIERIYNMDPEQRKDLAKVIKKQREEDAANAAAKKDASAAAGPAKLPSAIPGAGVKPSTFYFYNEAFVKKGKRDFARAWGDDRKLEDNWRRSNKISSGAAAEEIAAAPPTAPAMQDLAT
ncbi:MAG: hypothetical protein IPL65_15155 [Lewinellaceae bacterium]|nr:hypothetical protein [Lewinellaceae bacterium]